MTHVQVYMYVQPARSEASRVYIQSTLTRRFAWKIGNDIHYVVCGCIASQHMGFMRPLQAILCVADHTGVFPAYVSGNLVLTGSAM